MANARPKNIEENDKKRILQVALFATTAISAVILVHAQLAQLQATQDKQYKVKAKGGRSVVRDKSKPVRRALDEQYAKIVEAQKNEGPVTQTKTGS